MKATLLSLFLTATAEVSSSVLRRDDPKWDTATCTTPEVTDASIDQTKRWDSVDTEGAWKAALDDWKTKGKAGGLGFTKSVSNFFHGREQMACGSMSARDGCAHFYLCDDTSHPGGYFMMNSFVALSNLNWDIYDALGNAQGAITTQMGEFADTFAPIDDESEGLKLALDIVGLGFALVASPVWNSALKAIPFFKVNGNTLGTVKDWVNPAVSNGITIAKDTSISGATLKAQNDLTTNMGEMVKGWQVVMDDYNKNMFNGEDDMNDALYKQITGGRVLSPDFQEDELDVQNFVEKAVYGSLIPQAWPLSNRGLFPVVIDAKAPCGTDNPIEEYVTPDDGGKNFVCYDGGLYYLMGASTGPGDSLYCSDSADEAGTGGCTPNQLRVMPGVDQLDGTKWGGVTRDDFVAGAVNSYRANGNANGWPATDIGNPDAVDDIFDDGIRAAGVVMIPVCEGKEAYDNWADVGKKKSAHYPCN